MTPLKARRLDKGLCQREFARKCSVKPPTVCKWERGQNKPEPHRYEKIGEVLGWQPEQVRAAVYYLDPTPTL